MFNAHGHTHSSEKFEFNSPYIYHVGLDAHNLTPVSYEEMLRDIKLEYKIEQYAKTIKDTIFVDPRYEKPEHCLQDWQNWIKIIFLETEEGDRLVESVINLIDTLSEKSEENFKKAEKIINKEKNSAIKSIITSGIFTFAKFGPHFRLYLNEKDIANEMAVLKVMDIESDDLFSEIDFYHPEQQLKALEDYNVWLTKAVQKRDNILQHQNIYIDEQKDLNYDEFEK